MGDGFHEVIRVILGVCGGTLSSLGMTMQAKRWYFSNRASTVNERFHF
jgi:hypothetical protein